MPLKDLQRSLPASTCTANGHSRSAHNAPRKLSGSSATREYVMSLGCSGGSRHTIAMFAIFWRRGMSAVCDLSACISMNYFQAVLPNALRKN